MVGGSISLQLVPLDNARLDHSLRPAQNNTLRKTSSKKNNKKIEKNAPELTPIDRGADLTAKPSPPPSPKVTRERQVARLKAKAETVNSQFLTSMLPTFDHLASKSEEVVCLRLKPSPSQIAKVRQRRRKIVDALHKPSWGVKEKTASSGKRQRSQRADNAVLQRAKISLAMEEKATKVNLQREMKFIRSVEAKNISERATRWSELLAVGLSALLLRAALARGKHRRARRRSVEKIQAITRGKIQRDRDSKAKQIRSLLGLRVTMVVANLRVRVKRSHARCLTAFVLAIPASTKVFVALRLFRAKVIKVQRWWRSFLVCKLTRMRCLVRIWNLVEDAHKMEIKAVLRKSVRKKPVRSTSVSHVESLGSRGRGGGGGATAAPGGGRALTVKVRRLASECVKQYPAQVQPSKVLRHSRSADALNLKQLLRDIKPALGSSSDLLPRITMLSTAKKMLFSIAEDEKKRKFRPGQRHRDGTNSKKNKTRKKKQTKWSHNWDTWIVQMRRWNDADEGSGSVPRSNVPIEARISQIKSLLEETRLSFVRRSLVREGKLTGSNLELDGGDSKRLVSLHSMRHVIQGTMTMQELFDRSARPVFCPYTSKPFAEKNMVDVIVATHLSLGLG
jgi:hypothetical protein